MGNPDGLASWAGRLADSDAARPARRWHGKPRTGDARAWLITVKIFGSDFVLHSVQSHDLDGPGGLVEVTAQVQRHGRDDLALEVAVSRLSLEPAVSSVTWTTTEPEPAVLAAVEE